MPISSGTRHFAKCDFCGYESLMCMHSPEKAAEVARDFRWEEREGRWRCPQCATQAQCGLAQADREGREKG